MTIEIAEFPSLRAANEARQKEWDKDSQITLAYRGNELAGEVGEACNVIKKLERERMGIAGSRATREQLAEELADVIICADLIAMDAGIDLMGSAVPAKFNATSEKVGLATRLSTPDDGWRTIESAPKDGTVIDLWHEEFGRLADCYWGKPHHCCGEEGRYCDSEWHSEPECWVDASANQSVELDGAFTHWRPLPAPPATPDDGRGE